MPENFVLKNGSAKKSTGILRYLNTLNTDDIYIYIYVKILDFDLFHVGNVLKIFQNKSSLSACASYRGGSKDFKNGFNFLLAQKLTELEHFEISKKILKIVDFRKIAP